MSEFNEPLFEIAQLAHVEIYTPKPDETVWFFTELLGMEKTEALGQSVYLRAYEDFYHHSRKHKRQSWWVVSARNLSGCHLSLPVIFPFFIEYQFSERKDIVSTISAPIHTA